MPKRKKNQIILTTAGTPVYLIPASQQKPVKAIAFRTAGVSTFSLSPVLLPPTK